MVEAAIDRVGPAELRALVERHFRVYEARTDEMQGMVLAHRFFLMFPAHEFDVRYEAVRSDIKALDPDLLVFMRQEGGEDILYVTERPVVPPAKNRRNVVLLILTLMTTTAAGATFWQGYSNPGGDFAWSSLWDPTNLLWGGLTFALPLMAILGIHESAHFIAARRHGIRASLPYFIPIPPVILFPIGTLGAFIRLKDPLPDRKALFDVGASGPLAGFAVAVPLLVVGAFLTGQAAVDVPLDIGRPDVEADAFDIDATEPGQTTLTLGNVEPGTYLFQVTSPSDDWTYEIVATVDGVGSEGAARATTLTGTSPEGSTALRTLRVDENATGATVLITWNDGLVDFGDPLIMKPLNGLFDTDDYLTHPTFFAAWVGILITGINLLPAGQLDGGHVARAVLGERVRWAGTASIALLFFLAFQFSSWLLMALFLVLTGVQHPPPLNDRTELGTGRRILAAVVLLVFAVSFIPVPIQF